MNEHDVQVEIKTFLDVTRHLLLNDERCRNDDNYLVERAKAYCNTNNMKMPSYETITRCRRKLQESPTSTLRATKDVESKRSVKEHVYHNTMHNIWSDY